MTRPNIEIGKPDFLALPEPRRDGCVSVEKALSERRSVREYSKEPLSLHDVSQILWAAQGITARDGLRTAPSAGALYPLEVLLVMGEVPGVAKGVYRYRSLGHEIARMVSGDQRSRLATAALEQYWLAEAPVMLVVSAIYEQTTKKYHGKGKLYVHMEAGHVVQSVSLQAVAMGLGSVVIGAFEDISALMSCPFGKMQCGRKKPCPLHPRWKKVADACNDFLKKTTLDDITWPSP